MSQAEFMTAFLDEMRRKELASLDHIAPHLSSAKGRLWMMTLVTKQDLWWNQRDRVRNHYQQGPYHERIQALQTQRGQEAFRHEYVSASLVFANLRTEAGETLAPTVGGYDAIIRAANLQKVFSTALTLIGDRK
jgi:hypothetical protein